MIAIQSRKEDECEECYKTKTVYVFKINEKIRVECKACRDKRIDKWFDSKAPASTKPA